MATTEPHSGPTEDQQDSSSAPQSVFDRQSLNVPNLITLSRLVLAVVLFVMISVEGFWISAAVVFLVAAATDFLDGYIARRYGLVTTLGRILDPFVDKIIICGSFIFLLEKQSNPAFDSGVNAWMVVIVVGREMFVTGLRSFLEQQGHDFSASLSGKLKMVTQCVAVTLALLSLSPDVTSAAFDQIRDVVLWLMVAITVYSGFIYIYRAAVMLRPPSE